MMSMDAQEVAFVDWLNKRLNDRHWNQSELARVSGLSRGSISHVVNGTRKPGVDFCTAIAEAFKIDAEEVLRAAGLLKDEKKEFERIEKLARRISRLPEEDQEVIDALIERLLIKYAPKTDRPTTKDSSEVAK